MKSRRNERKFKFQARSMKPRNVNLPPTLIKGEYNGIDGGVVFPEQEPERQAKLMKYPFVYNIENEKQEKKEPGALDYLKNLIPIAAKGLKIKRRWDKAAQKQQNYDRGQNMKTAAGVGKVVGAVFGKKAGEIVGNVGKVAARQSGSSGRWV